MMKKSRIVVFMIFVLSLIFALYITEIANIKYFMPDRIEEVEQAISETIIDEEIDEVIENRYSWQINIPKLELIAPISEGTENDVLKNYVGHVRQTPCFLGNICLAAHNNTANYLYGNYYFDRIDELNIGDKVFYTYNSLNLKFKVSEIKEVYETDMSCLENNLDTKLTLITCIAGKREKRLVVICDLV